MKDAGGTGRLRHIHCAYQNNGEGCGVDGPEGSFGAPFNKNGGGVWATQVENDGVKVWFFRRGQEPSDCHTDTPNTNRWPKPVLHFTPDRCDLKAAFQRMKIIINITFCGQYAGGEAWNGYTRCAHKTKFDTCNEYVAKNPGVFKDVYFEINSIRVFEKRGRL